VNFEQARAHFPVLAHRAYLNAGSVGPLARETVEATEQWQRRELEGGRSGKAYFEQAVALREELRTRIAALVGAETEQVALTASTTDGCNIVLAGLDLRPQDEIVTTSDEHFGLLGPLHASGATVVVAAPDPEAIAAAVTPRTRLLAFSRVLWTTGRLLPGRALREQTGIPVLLDGAQAVGAIPTEAAGVDFLTVSAQKWLCGPDATGALVVAEPGRLRVGRPTWLAQMRYEPDGSFDPRPGAARFDSIWQASSTAGLLAALDLAPEWRFERAADMASRCRARLQAGYEVVTPPAQGTLVSWRMQGDLPARVAALHERGVIVRDIPGRGLLRASCGWWTSEEDIDRLLRALAEV
jgi:L-cysteine/cystine lyase